MKRQEWNGFTGGLWEDEIDVRNFIQKNYTLYERRRRVFWPAPPQRTLRGAGPSVRICCAEEHEERRRCWTWRPTRRSAAPAFWPRATSDKDKRGHRGPADRRAPEAGLSIPFGGMRMVQAQPAKPTAMQFRPQDRARSSAIPQDPQRGRILRLHPPRSAQPATQACSPVCPTPTAAAASSATTAGWPCTASTG